MGKHVAVLSEIGEDLEYVARVNTPETFDLMDTHFTLADNSNLRIECGQWAVRVNDDDMIPWGQHEAFIARAYCNGCGQARKN